MRRGEQAADDEFALLPIVIGSRDIEKRDTPLGAVVLPVPKTVLVGNTASTLATLPATGLGKGGLASAGGEYTLHIGWRPELDVATNPALNKGLTGTVVKPVVVKPVVAGP